MGHPARCGSRCGRRWRRGNPYYIRCLWALFALFDVELDGIVFFEGLVALGLNCGVVAEDVWSTFMLEETKTFCVVEPRNLAFVLRHWEPRLSVFSQ